MYGGFLGGAVGAGDASYVNAGKASMEKIWGNQELREVERITKSILGGTQASEV